MYKFYQLKKVKLNFSLLLLIIVLYSNQPKLIFEVVSNAYNKLDTIL